MVGADWIKSEVLKAVPNAVVEVIDLHGSGDHFHVRVISDEFEGVDILINNMKLINAESWWEMMCDSSTIPVAV